MRPDVVEQLRRRLPLETLGARAASENPGKTTNIIQQKTTATSSPRCCCRTSRSRPGPSCCSTGRPIPTGTQHSQRDSLGEFTPGINGPTSFAAIKVADDDLAAIIGDAEGTWPRREHEHRRHRRSWFQHDLQAEPNQPVGKS